MSGFGDSPHEGRRVLLEWCAVFRHARAALRKEVLAMDPQTVIALCAVFKVMLDMIKFAVKRD